MTRADVAIVINGERRAVEAGTSVARLVTTFSTTTKGLAVAVNGEVVPRSAWGDQSLDGGEHVEILGASQGG